MKFQVFPENADLKPRKRVKFGIDPTFNRLHLGHLVPLRLVRSMIADGHDVTIVLGTFTAQLGDPAGRDATRPILSENQVLENANDIQAQITRIIDGPFKIIRNHDIHNKMSVPEFLRIVSNFTLSHITSRNGFQERIDNKQPIAMHELLVPVCQGWDSVFLKTEIEIGGQDQLFNFQIARQLQEVKGQPPQASILMPIIRGTDGRKMSKSLNNCIFLDDKPEDIFGKVMSISDEVMNEWLPLLSDLSPQSHPMNTKKSLAFDIVKNLHGEEAANKALDLFVTVHQSKGLPEQIPEIRVQNLIEAIIAAGKVNCVFSASKGSARRFLHSGAVTLDGEKVSDEGTSLKTGQIIKVGKRAFARIVNAFEQ